MYRDENQLRQDIREGVAEHAVQVAPAHLVDQVRAAFGPHAVLRPEERFVDGSHRVPVWVVKSPNRCAAGEWATVPTTERGRGSSPAKAVEDALDALGGAHAG